MKLGLIRRVHVAKRVSRLFAASRPSDTLGTRKVCFLFGWLPKTPDVVPRESLQKG